VGEFKFLSNRPRVNDEEGAEIIVNVDLGLRLADGESPITLSLSPSTLPGEAPIGDNLLLASLDVVAGFELKLLDNRNFSPDRELDGRETVCCSPSARLVGVGGYSESVEVWLSRAVGDCDREVSSPSMLAKLVFLFKVFLLLPPFAPKIPTPLPNANGAGFTTLW
jgi:hypothetical protein